MKNHYIVLAESDFTHPITHSHTSELSNFAEADSLATDCVQDGERVVYIYQLVKVYQPRPDSESRDVEVVYID